MQNEMNNDAVVMVEVDAQALSADAYNNCCHFLIGKGNAESRD